MSVTRRSVALSKQDSERIENLRRRSGRSATASDTVRVATAVLLAETPVDDCDAELDQLAQELATGKQVWGYSVPGADDEAMSEVLRSMNMSVRRPSRSEAVRLGLLRASQRPDVEVARRFAELDHVPVGGAGPAWRAGSSIHDDLIRSLGADFQTAAAADLERRISSAVDPRVGWQPILVVGDVGRLAVHAWLTESKTTDPAVVPLYPTDDARTFARRLVPFICDAEEAVRRFDRESSRPRK